MRKLLGCLILLVGFGLVGSALTMDTTVRVNGSPAHVVGTTYGTESVAAIPDSYVHNIGLMQAQQNRLYLGGVLAVIGVLILVTGRPATAQSVPAAPPAGPPASEPQATDEEMRRFGIIKDGDAYAWGSMRFASPESALMVARSRGTPPQAAPSTAALIGVVGIVLLVVYLLS